MSLTEIGAIATCALVIVASTPAPAAPSRAMSVRAICDDDGRCYDTGPRFRDRDDDAPPPRRRFDPGDDDDRPPPRHRRYDPDDDRPPPPSRRRFDPDDDER